MSNWIPNPFGMNKTNSSLPHPEQSQQSQTLPIENSLPEEQSQQSQPLSIQDSKNNDVKGSLSTARMIKILSTSTSLLAGFAIINYNAVKNIINAVKNKVYEGKIYNGNEIPVINAILDSYVDTAVLVIKKGGFSTNFVNLFKSAVHNKFTLDLQSKLDATTELQSNNISGKLKKEGGKKRKTKKNRRHR